MEKTKTRTAIISMDENDILHIEVLDGVEIDHDDMIDNLLVVKGYIKGKKVLKLIDATGSFMIDKKSRELLKRVDAEQTIARAVYTNSPLKKILSVFFFQLSRPKAPTKVFTNYIKAYEWLLSFK